MTRCEFCDTLFVAREGWERWCDDCADFTDLPDTLEPEYETLARYSNV